MQCSLPLYLNQTQENKCFCIYARQPSPSLLFSGRKAIIMLLTHAYSLKYFFVFRSIDGSIENVIVRFPRFCNLKVSNDITENVISIRVRVSLKEQDQPITTSGGPTELCVQTRAHGSHSQIWPCYSLSLRQIVR